jgi:outer membrane protein assembly factor BamA
MHLLFLFPGGAVISPAKLARKFRIIWLIVLPLLGSCSYTRWIPEGSYLLRQNKVEVNGRTTAREDLQSIIKQKPNPGFIKTELLLYNLGNPNKPKGFAKWISGFGNPPVLLDSLQMLRTVKQLGLYFNSKGYFNAEVSASVSLFRGGKKKKHAQQKIITYQIYTRQPYVIRSIDHDIANPMVANIVERSAAQSLLKPDMIYDVSVLDAERDRITRLARNDGLFEFNKGLITYRADTALGNHGLRLKMQIADNTQQLGDSVFARPVERFVVSQIEIEPDYFSEDSAMKPMEDSYRGFQIREKNSRYHSSYLASLVHIEPGAIYKEEKTKLTYQHISQYGNFSLTDITYVIDSTAEDPSLKARIRMSPRKKRGFATSLEARTTSGIGGISGSVSYLDRNLFKGGEYLEIKLMGALDAQFFGSSSEGSSVFNTFEVGVETSLNFPRFLLPFSTYNVIPKRMFPRSKAYINVSRQSRAEFDRLVTRVGLNYAWNETSEKTHELDLIDFGLTDVSVYDPQFVNNNFFIYSFIPVVTPSLRYTFTFNNQKISTWFNHMYFKGSVETAGNLFQALSGVIPFYTDSNGFIQMFGVNITQYVKFTADYRYYLRLSSPKNVLALRAFAGYMVIYGNGAAALPFERMFFNGGAMDIRAWPAYTLGPGTAVYTGVPQVAPIKLMANAEYRFPIIGSLRSALFIDAGNIWWAGQGISAPENYLFKPGQILNETAVGLGTGARLDLSFFVIRIDAALPVREPYLAGPNKWFQTPLSWNTLTYTFGIGYPF